MHQGGSQYGVPPPEAEMASPISSLPPHELTSFPGDEVPPAAAEEEVEHGGATASGGGGNRWPRQETLALLRIRSDMDAVFRDATLKAPLWEEVSRKLAELGYKRSAKKCKEKFENVHKYYKRTKEGRAGRQDGKHYRFFSQLEALSTGGAAGHPVINPHAPAAIPGLSEVSTSSDDSDSDGGAANRKMMSFFKGLIKQVVDRQEAMQNRFLETIEKREQERMMREESWRRQDMARLARDHEAAAHDSAVAAARDTAIISFLQQLAGQPPPPPPPPADDGGAATSSQKAVVAAAAVAAAGRWPKAEVQALIKLRGEMEIKYQDVGPKGPLWEEISSEMRQLGYTRSAKRCKEKWENINKYFKKVKESNKRRPEDSKTCPYFHQLDALYRKKRVPAHTPPPEDASAVSSSQKVGEDMELTRREENGERVNSEEMVSDEAEREEEHYKIEYQQNSGVNGTVNGGAAIYGHNSVKIQDQRSDLSPISPPLFQA